MFTVFKWETENTISQEQQGDPKILIKWEIRNINQMQIQKQAYTWQQRIEPSFLLKFPQNTSHKIAVSRNLAGFSIPVALQITWYTDFPWEHFMKTLLWLHIIQKISLYCKFNVLFIWLKIAAVSAWNFKLQISCFLYMKTFEVW